MSAAALPVLMYHHVSPSPGLVTVSPQTFAHQMQWLRDHGYLTLGADELERFLAGEPLADKSVVVTFDDGYLDNYVYAHPVLARLKQRALLFLITGRIGEGPARTHSMAGTDVPHCPSHRECMQRVAAGEPDAVMLRWSEVEAMRAAGSFEFHSHTHTHTRWDERIAETPARLVALADDLEKSRAALRQRLGAASAHLCWPQGYYDADYRRVARDAGFRYLYTTHKAVTTRGADPERIGRFPAKDRADEWFGRRIRLYGNAVLGRLYLMLRGS
jgi:peptidoglycan/xylan/chitin deacetylase (PgdA/CDA1 family)